MAANGGGDVEEGAVVRAVAKNGGGDDGSGSELPSDKLMLELRKYLLLLAILAATVTYAAGLNPPGGVWLDTQGGHLTGNQILVVTYHARYNAFSYSNATAFMASAVVILLLVFGFRDTRCNNPNLFVVLRVVMVLDLLALVVAYAAGASRDTLTTVLASLLVSLILILYVLLLWGESKEPAPERDGDQDQRTGRVVEDKRQRKILMLLAIFATTITYTVGLNPPGGFWPDTDTEDGHRAGDPVLQHHHRLRFAVFFICNTISFVASLFVIMLLLTHTHRFIKCSIGRFQAKAKAVRYASMVISLLGLVGAYAAGSCRETNSTAAVVVLYVVVGVGPMLALVVFFALVRQRGNPKDGQGDKTSQRLLMTDKEVEDGGDPGLIINPKDGQKDKTTQRPLTDNEIEDGGAPRLIINHKDGQEDKTPRRPLTKKKAGLINTAPSLVLLLATLAATVTYQAGLNPPGGFWPDHRDGHKGGDPILFSKHAVRFRLFFYCNSTALAASLVVILMVLRNYLSKPGSKNKNDEKKPEKPQEVGKQDEKNTDKGRIGAHVVILQVVMILDLIGLIGAFAVGCCRDVSTSIYVVALGGGALVYVVFHIVFFTMHDHDLQHKDDMEENDLQHKDDMEEKRKLLLLLAILAVTLTYQAGLTPPGGFWLGDDSEVGHQAGDPVLLSNYPRRYTAFFYLNATGFMASVALTILLVNPNLYRAGIKCYALHVCMVASLFGLMGAYAAGSSRHVRTSIYMIALIVLVFTFVTVLLLVLLVFKIIKPDWPWIEKWSPVSFCRCSSKAAAGMAATIDQEQSPAGNHVDTNNNPASTEEPDDGANKAEASSSSDETGGIEPHTKRRYLMLLGILAASVTYQAGLAPPGGVWPDNNDGHAVGNPILRDSSHHRYHMFFYCNSASFVASVVVITLQLLVDLTTENIKAKSLIQTAQWMMVLDLVGLLLAYAAGSTREWETSGYFVALLVAFCIVIHVVVSFFHNKYCGSAAPETEKNHTLSTV